MTRRSLLLAVVGVVGVAAGLLCRLTGNETLADLVFLGTAIVAGEMLELRPPGRPAVPLSFAVFVVLARAASGPELVVTLVCAEVIACALREGPLPARIRLFAARVLTGLVAGVVFDAVARSESAAAVLGGALCSIVAALVVAELVTGSARRHAPRRPGRPLAVLVTERSTDLIVVSCAVLMAASYGGVQGDGNLGLWGVALFAIPALMAMYSFERLAKIRAAFDQTIDALATVPEIGGWVAPGRTHRIADLAVATGETLGMDPAEVDRVCSAALLRELGRVCLDDPATTDAREVLQLSSSVLSASPTLTGAGLVLTAELDPADATALDRLAGEVVGTCVAFEDATHGAWIDSPAAAQEGLRAIRPDHDSVVVDALRRGLSRRLPA